MDIILLLLLLFFIILFLSYSSVREYFSNGINYLEGIDKIYWINLERSKDRYEIMTAMFEDPIFNNIDIERINAFDGKKNDPLIFFTKENKKIIRSPSEYACLLSHLQTIKKFSESNYNVALIMEDDNTLEFKPYWKKTIKQIMNNAPSDWEIIQLWYSSYVIPENEYTKINNNINNSVNYWGTCSYIIKRSAAQKMIEKIYLPDIDKYRTYEKIDSVADNYIYDLLTSYTYKYPMFVYKTLDTSTIHGDHVDGQNKIKKMISKNLYPEYYKKTYSE
jgi:GR25 family glycosyltransferase involved in LPS biosynthesis